LGRCSRHYPQKSPGEISEWFGREISRVIASLRAAGLIAAGSRSPQPGARYTYVTTVGFLAEFGFDSLPNLPDPEKLEDVGLLGRTKRRSFKRDDAFSQLEGAFELTAVGDDDLEEDAT
jgi:segregation and condensation protein B